MACSNTRTTRGRGRARGFTLVEAIASIVLVGVLLIAALSAAGASASMRQNASSRDFAAMLAADLAEEIDLKGYGGTTGGTITGAILAGTRATFTTIDDYNGLEERPPVTGAGVTIDGAANYSRQTAVQRVTLADPTAATTTETGVKRITITVYRSGTALQELQIIRTRAWDLSRN